MSGGWRVYGYFNSGMMAYIAWHAGPAAVIITVRIGKAMLRALSGYTSRIQTLFSVVEGNAWVIVVTEGISAVPYQWYTTYLTLYMLALGVTEVQVGLLSSLLILTQLVGTALGGFAADRFGRRWVLVVFDILCWGVPMFLYAIAQNPWYFLVGRFINGFIYIVSPAFDCLFVEDVPEQNRPAVFSMFQFMTSAASLLAPVAGLMVMRWGMVTAGRVIMAFCLVVMVGIAVLRWFTLRETTVARERMAATAAQPWRSVLRDYRQALISMFRVPQVRSFLLVRGLAEFAGLMWATYAVIFLADVNGIGLDASLIAYLPFVFSLATLLLIFLAAGHLQSGKLFQNLVMGQGLWLLSGLVFVLSPRGTIWPALIATFIQAISVALFLPASRSYWANIVGDSERAQVFSASATLISCITLPAAPLAGLLYLLSPRLPLIVALLLQGGVLVLLLGMRPTIEAPGRRVGPLEVN